MALMWLAVVVAGLLPVLGVLFGLLRWPRDFFAGLLFAQALVYLFVAPTIAAQELSLAIQSRYTFFLWWGLALFCLPFLAGYLWMVGRLERRWSVNAGFRVRSVPSAIFVGGSLVLGAGYLWVALSRNLLYRRLGWEGLAVAQLDLSLAEFAFYRTFIEAAPFLVTFSLAVLRLGRPAGVWIRQLWRIGLAATSAVYGVHVLANSRLGGLLFLSALAGVTVMTAPAGRRMRPERVVLGIALVIIGLYMLRVTENVRERIAIGGSPFAMANLLPGGSVGGGEEGYEWRLNGVDLMAIIADNVESQGPALGRAWVVPLLVSLDPIVRTDLTEQLKRGTFTNAKTVLLLLYAGLAVPDYYSCMVSDAYGNFGLLGFSIVALALAGLCAFATAGFCGGAGPSVLVLACFTLARMLPFEQEFATLMFGWFKLVPLVTAVVIVNPMARLRPTRNLHRSLVPPLPVPGTG